jgi:putative transcriptional regulator
MLGDRSRYWLARETGISEGNLRKLARGQTTSIKFENLEKICRALGCSPGDMLVLVDPRSATKKKAGSQKPTPGNKRR